MSNQLPDHTTESNQLPDHTTESNAASDHTTESNQLPDHTTESNQLPDHTTESNQLPDHTTESNAASVAGKRPNRPDPAELMDMAVGLAREAGELITSMRSTAIAEVDTKSSVADVVTAGDKAAEKLITDALTSSRPADAILGEEGADKPGTSGLRWIIDPIDGTTNYLYGLPGYTVSIAVSDGDDMVAGAIYDPGNDLMFAAGRGLGALMNGEPIRCSAKGELSTALVATGFGYAPDRRRGQAHVLTHVLPQVRDIRRSGSAALDLCLVASGLVDAYYERGLNLWDLAAGWLVATEAGAMVEDLRGGRPSSEFVLAAGPELFAILANELRKVDADQGY